MTLKFCKYQGTGNDFLLVDNREGVIRLSNEQIRFLCNRKFGVGSDGLILLEADGETDFYMNFYNPDGSQSFCGNGSRCAVHFYLTLNSSSGHVKFRAIDGVHQAVASDGEFRILMRDVAGIEKLDEQKYFLSTGSPHIVWFIPRVSDEGLMDQARQLRYSERWKKEGVNVNFIEVKQPGIIKVRTYERGVEDETLSCGTGVTASALAYHHLSGWNGNVQVNTPGGDLNVTFTSGGDAIYRDVWLCGPAQKVFEGLIQIH